MQRIQVITGNWKMHKTIDETMIFIQEILPHLKDLQVAVFLAVPYTAIQAAALGTDSTPLLIGAQNMHDADYGAYTGEISCHMLQEAGARFVLLGHSERRTLFGETNAAINRKIKKALLNDLTPTLCIGESLKEFEAHKTHDVLAKQLKTCLADLSAEEIAKVILAYEPVWAIGTGKTASPDIAQKTHQFCRQFIADAWTSTLADGMTIQYGGSVKPDNIQALLAKPDIDGALVGGASLDLESFKAIINQTKESVQR